MGNRTYLIIIGISLLIAFFGIVMANFSGESMMIEKGWDMFDYGLSIGALTGLVLMVGSGTFIRTRFYKIALACIAIILIGALLKILHWSPFANHIVVLGLLGIMISYSFSFVKKPIKIRLDYLKLIWVIVTYLSGILVFSHILDREYSDIGRYIF